MPSREDQSMDQPLLDAVANDQPSDRTGDAISLLRNRLGLEGLSQHHCDDMNRAAHLLESVQSENAQVNLKEKSIDKRDYLTDFARMQNNVMRESTDMFDGVDEKLKAAITSNWATVKIHTTGDYYIKLSTLNASASDVFTCASKINSPGYIFNPGDGTTALSRQEINRVDRAWQQKHTDNMHVAPNSFLEKDKTERLRQYTYKRVISSQVSLLADLSKNVTVATACAPNLMGTGAQEKKYYVSGEAMSQNYINECTTTANLIIKAALAQSKKKIVMPDFGLGAYLSRLDSPQKAAARQAMVQAFATALNDHNSQQSDENKLSIYWVIYNNERDKARLKSETEKAVQKSSINKNRIDDNNTNCLFSCLSGFYASVLACCCKRPNINHFNVVEGDVFEMMVDDNYPSEDCMYVNPGSDRTIGGGFCALNARPLEEQFAQKTTLLAVQSSFNPCAQAATLRGVNEYLCSPEARAKGGAMFQPVDRANSGDGGAHSREDASSPPPTHL